MNDQRTDTDLEMRLRGAFRSADLPAAPGSLADALERVPDAPVVRGDAQGSRASGARRSIFGLLGVAAVLLVGGALAVTVGSRPSTPPAPSEPSTTPATAVVYQVGWTAAVPHSATVLAEEVRIVQERVDATGAVGVVVSSDGADRLTVSIPTSLDAGPLRTLVGQTGRIEFVPLGDTPLEKGDVVDPAKFPELFGSEGVASATVSTSQNGGRVVVFELTPAAAAQFGTYTAANIGSYFAIALDGLVVSAPMINSEIPGGSVEISQAGVGGWDLAQANELATIIRLKPLPVPLTEISSEPGPVDPSASPDETPSPSNLVLPSEPPTTCEAPIDVPGSQLDCHSAVRAALAILPAVRPTMTGIDFSHTCFDERHPDAVIDCAVQMFGIVQVTYVGGSTPILIGVRAGEGGELLAFLLPGVEVGIPTFALERTPADLGCDAMAPPYRSLVIHIDPTKTPPVWAIADTKARLRVLWGAADHGLGLAEPVVLDAFRRELAVDGTRIDIPDGAWPSLGGRFVCPGPDAVYVTDQPAAQP
jgi:hypothetical protein